MIDDRPIDTCTTRNHGLFWPFDFFFLNLQLIMSENNSALMKKVIQMKARAKEEICNIDNMIGLLNISQKENDRVMKELAQRRYVTHILDRNDTSTTTPQLAT